MARDPRPAILDRIPAFGHVVLEASAGTGKTYTIEHLVVELLLASSAQLEELLVLTFTDRAARELRRRIRAILRWVLEPRGGAPLDEEHRRKVERSLARFDAGNITTIHGFLQSVLTSEGFLLGRLFRQELVDGRGAFGETIRQRVRARWAHDPLHVPYLSAWIRTEEKSLAALENLLWRCHLSRDSIEPRLDRERLGPLLEAWPTDAERFEKELRETLKSHEVHGKTADAVAKRAMRLLEIGLNENDAAESLIARISASWAGDAAWIGAKIGHLNFTPAAASWLVEFASAVVPLAAVVADRFLPDAAAELRRTKSLLGRFDFGDMIDLVHEALFAPEGAALVARLRDRFRCVILDEFQDTDGRQWAIFRRVFGDPAGDRRIIVVGDPKQAIYAFRGADVSAYLSACRELSPNAEPIRLEENFRSTSDYIAAVNRILDQSAAPPFFQGEIDYRHPVAAGRPEMSARRVSGQPLEPVVVWAFEQGDRKWSSPSLREALGRAIAAEILEITGTSPRAIEHGPNKRSPHQRIAFRDVFVLTSTNSEGRELATYLRAGGIPHAFFRQEGLFESDEAAALRDLLFAIGDPANRRARWRAWLTPFFSVPLEELAACREAPDHHPLAARLFAWREASSALPFDQFAQRLIEESGLLRRELFANFGERALTNYLHLFDLLAEEQRQRGAAARDLAEALAAWIDRRAAPAGMDADVQRLESERDAVQILTMHKAKGLEAPIVFLYGGLFARPKREEGVRLHFEGRRILYLGADESLLARAKAEQAEEHERLLYVALTRAKLRVYLPYIPEEAVGKKIDGANARLHQRLRRIVSELEVHPDPLFATELIGRESRREVAGGAARGPADPPGGPAAPPDPAFARQCGVLRSGHAPLRIESYTSMKRGVPDSAETVETMREDDESPRRADLEEDDLPAGPATGRFIHEVLERLPLETLADGPPRDAWVRIGAVDKLFARAMLRHGLPPRFAARAKALVYAALSSDVRLPGPGVISGLGRAAAVAREMEFLYPYPEPSHPTFVAEEHQRWEIERGYIRGFVDFVFLHGDRLYFVDWKTDLLEDYRPQTLASAVLESYELQVKLYVLAMAKLLRVRSAEEYQTRFGGLLYCFLRGMSRAGAGVHFQRPAWDELLGYREELLRRTRATAPRGVSS